MILTVSNLYPRPDEKTRGLFNAQLFKAISDLSSDEVKNVCLVPSWQAWQWPSISLWKDPSTEGPGTIYTPCFYVPVIGRNLSWRTYARALGSVARFEKGLSAVVATWLYPDAVAASVVAAKAGVPLCILVNGSDVSHMLSKSRRRMILKACESAAAVGCVSKELCETMVDWGVASEKVQHMPNGVDSERFCCRSSDEARKKLGEKAGSDESEDVKTLLFVGNLVPVKGLSDLIVAVAALQREQKVRLVIVGDGPEMKRLKSYVSLKKVAGQVKFVGSVDHEKVADWMNAADCLCLPSVSEGMPNVVLEAVSSGLPVVASDVGACRDIAGDDPACRIVDRASDRFAGRFAEAIKDVLSKDIDRRAMADRFKGRYSWKKQAEAVLEAIEKKGSSTDSASS